MKLNMENMKETIIELELYIEDGKTYAYISEEGSSGYKCQINSSEELGQYITGYVNYNCIKED